MNLISKRPQFSKIVAVLPPVAALASLVLIIAPVNSAVIDLLLSLSFIFAVSVFISALALRDLRELSSFPSILLFGTIFRLALNVATTRLILLNGGQSLEAAGQVIRSFGEFVVQGDFAVGIIVYIVIATVNFLVIAKGSTRVAEVSARFSLDALPGRQLAIDAELRSGKISSTEADDRRRSLNAETKFFGAMDGAMRFVQGDAIAGVIIVLINALGGIALGASRGLDLATAAGNFGVLAIGDGLVNIIPSILFSAAAGILVTQVSREKKVGIGEEVISQIFGRRSTLVYSGVFLLLLGMIPGFPQVAFLLIGGLMVLLAYLPRLFDIRQPIITADRFAALLGSDSGIPVALFSKADKLSSRIEIAVQIENRDELISAFLSQFVNCYSQTGICPPLPNINIAPAGGSIGRIRCFIGSAQSLSVPIPSGSLFIEGAPAAIQLFSGAAGDRVTNEFSLKAGSWVSRTRVKAEAAGTMDVRVIGLAEFIAELYFSFCIEHIEYCLDVDQVSALVSHQRSKTPELVSELFDRGLISRAEYSQLLKELVTSRINISDQLLIMDRTLTAIRSLDLELTRSEFGEELIRELRKLLSPGLFRDATSPLRLFYLGSEVEEQLQRQLSPKARATITESLHKLVETMVDKGSSPVTLACSDDVVDQLTLLTQDTPGLRGRTRVFGYRQLASYKHVERLGLIQL